MCTKQLGYVFLGAYRGSGILPARRYMKRFCKTHWLDERNNPSGKLVREFAIRDLALSNKQAFVLNLAKCSELARYAQGAYANPSARWHSKKENGSLNAYLVREVNWGFMCAGFEVVRSTKKEIGTHYGVPFLVHTASAVYCQLGDIRKDFVRHTN